MDRSNYLEIDRKKLLRHRDKIEKFLNGEIPVPITLEIQPTEKCSCNCPHCQSRQFFAEDIRQEMVRHGAELDLELLDKILQSPPDNVIISGTTGEPLLYPYINELLLKLHNKNIPITLLTNGLNMDSELAGNIVKCCTTVRISLDAADEAAYAESHGVNAACWKKVTDHIVMLVNEKRLNRSKCGIGIGYLTDTESDEIEKAARLALDLGVDFIDFRPFQKDRVYPINKALLKKISESRIFETKDFKINSSHQKYHTVKSIERTYDFCHCAYFYTILDANGDLYLCCNRVGDAASKYGSLKDTENWETCLKSGLKKRQASDVKQSPLGCRLHTYNIILDGMVNNVDYSGLAYAEYTLNNEEASAWECI